MEKLTVEEFGQVIMVALREQYTFNYRLGQSLFNAVYEVSPDLANSLRNTGADCFHQDSKIIHFVNAILK